MEPMELLREDAHILFKQAREMSKDMPMVFCAQAMIDTHCDSLPYCLHCKWRNFEKTKPGFRRVTTKSEIIANAKQAENEHADWLSLVSGCKGDTLPDYFYDRVRDVSENSKIKSFGLFGATGKRSLTLLKKAGMYGYRCGIESPNAAIMKKVRPGDSFDARLRTIRNAKEIGMKVWSGLLMGLGESIDDIAHGMKILKELDVDAVSIGWFTPVPFTEMEADNPPNPFWAAKVVAATRIYLGKIDMIGNRNPPEWEFRAGCNGILVNDSREMLRLTTIRDSLNALEQG